MGQEDLLEKRMATHSSILALNIPWTEEPGRIQFMGSQRDTADQHFLFSLHSEALLQMMRKSKFMCETLLPKCKQRV